MCIYEVVEKGQSDLNDDLNDYEYNLTLIKYILYISDKKLLVEQRIPQTKTLLRRRLTKMMMKLKLYKHDLDFECHVVRVLKYCNVKMGWNLCFIKRSKIYIIQMFNLLRHAVTCRTIGHVSSKCISYPIDILTKVFSKS